MFEIIMLIAFLMAATSQLLPNHHASNRLAAKKTEQERKNRHVPSRQSAKKADKNRGNAKRRNRDYGYAA